MDKKIIWSKWVQRDIQQILSYRDERSGTTKYSDRIAYEAIAAAELIAKYPAVGAFTGQEKVFQKIVEDHFLLIYRLHPNQITILRFWDTRQNPRKLKRYLK